MFRVSYGPFRYLCNRELLTQMEAKMIHFVILTVPPPCSDHSISSRKWPETDVFREVIKFETVWPGDLPWWCYALNYGRYVEEGPLE
jgi:hypothetical protein